MYFKLSNGHAKRWLISVCFFTSIQPSLAAELQNEKSAVQANKTAQLTLGKIDFSAQPSSCIALRHGRTCYANVTLNWVSATKQDYCIYIKPLQAKKSQEKSVKCWKNSQGNQVVFNFESNQKVEFQLMSSKDNKVIAETAVEVSWVHKATPRKRRWRLF
jgi:hypothetical protein